MDDDDVVLGTTGISLIL